MHTWRQTHAPTHWHTRLHRHAGTKTNMNASWPSKPYTDTHKPKNTYVQNTQTHTHTNANTQTHMPTNAHSIVIRTFWGILVLHRIFLLKVCPKQQGYMMNCYDFKSFTALSRVVMVTLLPRAVNTWTLFITWIPNANFTSKSSRNFPNFSWKRIVMTPLSEHYVSPVNRLKFTSYSLLPHLVNIK